MFCHRFLIAIVGFLFAGEAIGQSNPNLQTGATPTATQWNSYFGAKADYPGFLSATNTWTGAQTFNGGAACPTKSIGDNTTACATTAFIAQGITFAVANAAPLWQRSSSVSANGVPFSYIVNTNPFTGGVGGANYTDEVVSWGWNLSNTVQVPFNAAQAATFDTWESKFFPGSGATYVVERHIGMVDTVGTVHRAISFQLPWDGLGNTSVNSFPAGASFVLDYINFNNWAGSQVIKWNLFGNVAQVNNGFFFNFNANNYVPLRQFNAANSAYVNLPWVDSGNNLRFDAPSIFGSNGGTTGSIGIFGATSGAATLTTGATGGHLSVVQAGSGTPTLTAGCNGAGSIVSGNDTAGTITGQTAAATSCTLTFGTAYASAPNCVASGQSSPLTGAFTPSTTGIVVNFASTANYKWSYICFGI